VEQTRGRHRESACRESNRLPRAVLVHYSIIYPSASLAAVLLIEQVFKAASAYEEEGGAVGGFVLSVTRSVREADWDW
jgi:hypothetical protein